MAISNIKATINKNIKTVWDTVTSLKNYMWRSDLSKIEILEINKIFIEYTKNGYPTTFTITSVEPFRRYEFDMENEDMNGHWKGLFCSDDERTLINFTENVIAKKILMKPFVKIYLKRQQATYIHDLRKYLEKG
jgi:hypothetical protein